MKYEYSRTDIWLAIAAPRAGGSDLLHRHGHQAVVMRN